MPNPYFPLQSVAVAGTGSAANLVASSSGQSIRVFQLIASGTGNDTVSLSFTAAGTATTAKIREYFCGSPHDGLTVGHCGRWNGCAIHGCYNDHSNGLLLQRNRRLTDSAIQDRD